VIFIVHSRREVNTGLREGRYSSSMSAGMGLFLYELDDEPLATPKPLSPADEYETARRHFVRAKGRATL